MGSLGAKAADSNETVQVPGEMRAEERVTQRANNMTQIINFGMLTAREHRLSLGTLKERVWGFFFCLILYLLFYFSPSPEGETLHTQI